MPTEESSADDQHLPSATITAPPGTKEYERQFEQQASRSVQAIARMPLVRVICGLLSILYFLLIILSSYFFLQEQREEGLRLWDLFTQLGFVVFMGWLILLQGRIALHGEFETKHDIFIPKQK